MIGTIGLAELLALAAFAAACVVALLRRRGLRLQPATSELPGSGRDAADRGEIAIEPVANPPAPWWCRLDWLRAGGPLYLPRPHAGPVGDAAEATAAGHGGGALNALTSRAAGKAEAGIGTPRPTAGYPMGRTDGNSIVRHLGGPAP